MTRAAIPAQRLYYLTAFTDEVMPCAPHLDAWAAWLSAEDPQWPHDIPPDGEVFDGFVLAVLGDRRADFTAGRWTLAQPAPEGTHEFFLRHHEGSAGWNVEYAGADLESELDELDADDGDACWVACVSASTPLHFRYHAAPPRLEVLRPS